MNYCFSALWPLDYLYFFERTIAISCQRKFTYFLDKVEDLLDFFWKLTKQLVFLD
jgi:hypothetical protein